MMTGDEYSILQGWLSKWHRRGAGDVSINPEVKRTAHLYMEMFSMSWLEALS